MEKVVNTAKVLGGVPMRTLKVGSKFLPNIPPASQDPIAGLPYALGQLLLQRSAEDREAQSLPKQKVKIEAAWSKKHGHMKAVEIDASLYGAASLELPNKEAEAEAPKAIGGPTAAAEGSHAIAAAEESKTPGSDEKASATVAPA